MLRGRADAEVIISLQTDLTQVSVSIVSRCCSAASVLLYDIRSAMIGYLIMPTACKTMLLLTAHVTSWQQAKFSVK